MDQLLNNYVNGNLKDAKEQARKFSETRIYDTLRERGYAVKVAGAIAAYLKGHGTFQDAADAEAEAKGI